MRLHRFRFSWGYVESARIAQLPTYLHVDGFETVEEAAESFARCLMTQGTSVRSCQTHGQKTGKFCNECGKPLVLTTPSYQFAYKYFNGLYTIDEDQAPSSNTEYWDEDWLAEWEVSLKELDEHPVVLVQNFNSYLYEANPEFLIYQK